ncbi:MAG: DUF6671 family protein [Cyanobacteriota bacterium]|nr:DUF6671 family protein [Cyanobacteriota bacterium]
MNLSELLAMTAPYPGWRDYFAGRSCVIATMHGKENVIAPLVTATLGVEVSKLANFNTDVWGTFTREVARPADQISTARLKAEAAMDQSGSSLAIASEGSFAPHPAIPFIAADREVVLLYDRQHQLQVYGEVLSTHTNFASTVVVQPDQAVAFAEKVGFPEHGIVVMADPRMADSAPAIPSGIPPSGIYKDIASLAELRSLVNPLLARSGRVRLETDMRAHRNPTRMQVIAQATHDLLEKLQQQCPACGLPGFQVVEVRAGLPCQWCGIPTSAPRAHLYRCQGCHHQQETLFPHGKTQADPASCLHCNP